MVSSPSCSGIRISVMTKVYRLLYLARCGLPPPYSRSTPTPCRACCESHRHRRWRDTDHRDAYPLRDCSCMRRMLRPPFSDSKRIAMLSPGPAPTTVIVPPRSATMSWTTTSPSPVLSLMSLVVKNGCKRRSRMSGSCHDRCPRRSSGAMAPAAREDGPSRSLLAP